MTTIHVVIAEKQYSSSKVLAAFDDAELAGKLKDTIEATEPRWTITVQPVELQKAPPKPFTVTIKSTPDVYWNGTPARVSADGDDFVADFPPGGPAKGTITVRDGAPEVFIPSNSAAAEKL